MRACVYNRYLSTMGGGERYAGMLAAVLAEDVDHVDLLSHDEVGLDVLAAHLGIDLGKVHLRVVPDTGETDVAEVSADYDLFVNASYMSRLVPRARHSVYIVYFPTPHDHDLSNSQRALLRYVGPLVREPAGGFGHGRGWFPAEGGRRRTWTWTTGDGVLAVSAGRDRELTFDVGRPGAPDGCRLRVTAGGRALAEVDVDPQSFVPVVVGLRPDEHGTELHFESDTFTPGVADSRQLGVAVSRMRLAGSRLSPRQWVGYRLPYLRRDPGNLEYLTGYDAVVAISEYSRGWVQRYWDMDPEVLFPPVHTSAVSPGEKRDRILSIGRFFGTDRGHNKKQLEMVDTFVGLRRRGLLDGWDYHLVGGCSAEDEAYVARVRAAAAGHPVEVHTNAPRALVADLLATSKVFWHATGLGEDVERTPWLFEHFGITTVEAMAAGCVPVVINAAGQVEIVRDGVDGFRFASATELAEATARVAVDDALRARLAAAARRRAEVFSEHEFAQTWRAIVARVLARQAP